MESASEDLTQIDVYADRVGFVVGYENIVGYRHLCARSTSRYCRVIAVAAIKWLPDL